MKLFLSFLVGCIVASSFQTASFFSFSKKDESHNIKEHGNHVMSSALHPKLVDNTETERRLSNGEFEPSFVFVETAIPSVSLNAADIQSIANLAKDSHVYTQVKQSKYSPKFLNSISNKVDLMDDINLFCSDQNGKMCGDFKTRFSNSHIHPLSSLTDTSNNILSEHNFVIFDESDVEYSHGRVLAQTLTLHSDEVSRIIKQLSTKFDSFSVSYVGNYQLQDEGDTSLISDGILMGLIMLTVIIIALVLVLMLNFSLQSAGDIELQEDPNAVKAGGKSKDT